MDSSIELNDEPEEPSLAERLESGRIWAGSPYAEFFDMFGDYIPPTR